MSGYISKLLFSVRVLLTVFHQCFGVAWCLIFPLACMGQVFDTTPPAIVGFKFYPDCRECYCQASKTSR